MAKQLNVNLQMTANTSQAKQQIAELDKLLTNLSVHASKSNSLGLDKELTKSVEKAAELKAILNSSLNVKGGLDLGKFNSELKKSKTNLKDYASSLIHLGPQGEQAFVQLARSISAAEVPLKRSNAILREFATTMKNTVRWQISSSVLHGFMGTIQKAYGYVEDLNESLNNIRIVTGQSTEQMAKFAKEANRAAKELNTTTTSYTDAALIYYQQGLSDKQVKERTDVTIKMANVARESATEVSSYMTAIWNNFDKDGTESLEHFGDVITRLGAETAASSAEIAHGLEKFAAVADTIGLSYEYATSAIATIVDKTRQSEDIVGTALKTIFARIQGLNLGETLEDGTTFNKYSKALEVVGISVKDQNGELRNMDSIILDMMDKWKTLSKDQQVALAQTVAGVRQYNQLVALMDNQDAFKANLAIAQDSDGSLQEQADIYAESWEAARDRVKAAAEGIYDSLLNDKFFITILDGFEKLLTTLENIIDGLGGMGGAIALAGSLLFKYFGPDIAESIDNGIYNMTLRSKGGLEEILRLRKQASEELKKTFSDTTEDTQHVYSPANVKGEVYSQEAELQDEMLLKNEEMLSQGKKMSELEQQKLQIMLDESKALGEIAVNKSKQASENDDNLQTNNKEIVRKYGSKYNEIEGKEENLSSSLKKATDLEKKYAALDKTYLRVKASQKAFGEDISKATDYIKKMCSQLDMNEEEIEDFMKTFEGCSDIESIVNALGTKVEELGEQAQSAFNEIDEGTGAIKGFSDVIKNAQQEAWNTGNSIGEAGKTMLDYEEYTEKTSKSIKNAKEEAYSFGECVGALGNGIMTLASATSALIGLGSIWSDEDLSTGEKVLTTVTTLGMIIPMVAEAYSGVNLEKIKNIGLSLKELILSKGIQLGKLGEKATIEALNAAKIKEILLETIKQALDWKKIAITLAVIAVLGTLVAITAAVINAMNAQVEAEKRANEVAENSEKKYQDLKTAYEELKSSIEDYEDSLKAFQEMSKGADGYAEALERVNEQARQLIEENGLYNNWSYGDNGEIVIDPSELEKVLNQANQTQLRAGSTAAAAAITATQTQKDGLYNKYNKTTEYNPDGTSYTYVDSDKVQALNDLGQLEEEQFKTLLDYANSFGDETQISLDELAESMNLTSEQANNLTAMIRTMGESAEENYNALHSYEEKLNYQIEQQALRGAQETRMFDDDAIAQNAYANLLSQNKDYQEKAVDNAQDASDISEGGKEGLKELLRNDGYDDFGKVFSDEDLAIAYAKYVEGWTDDQIDGAVYDGSWGNGKLTSGDESFEHDDQYMRDAIANAILSKQLAEQSAGQSEEADYGEQLRADIELLQGLSENVSNAALGALSNYEEGETLQLDYSLLSPEDIAELEDVASQMGSEYADAMLEATENYDASEYWDRLDAQQSANIDNQIATEDLDADIIETQTELIMENTEALEDNENAAKQLAVNNARMNKGMETLIDNWDDWSKALKEGDKTSEEYAKTITDMRSCLGDLVGLTDELEGSLSTSFFESAENLELLERAANADETAIRELGVAVAQDLTAGMEVAEDFVDAFDELKDGEALSFGGQIYNSLDEFQTAFNTAKENVLSVIDEISQAELQVGDNLADAIGEDDLQSFVEGLNQMAIATNMSVADMQAMLNTLGVEANVTETEVNEPIAVPIYETHKEPIEFNGPNKEATAWKEWSVQTGTETFEGSRMVAAIKYSKDGSDSASSQINYVGHGSASTGNKTKAADAAKKRSGGGSTPKHKSKENKNRDDEIERYHDVTEALEDVAIQLDMIGKAKDRAFGAGKLKNIKSEIALLQQENKLLQQQYDEASRYLEQDKAEAAKYGWSYDKNGDITNYESNMNRLLDELEAETNYYNSLSAEAQKTYDETLDANDKTKLDRLQEEYDKAIAAKDKLEESSDKVRDTLKQMQEVAQQIADAELESIEVIVNLTLEVDDAQLKYLQALFDNIGDSADHAADKIENIEKQIAKFGEQMKHQKEGLESYLKLAQQYSNGLSDGAISNIVNGTASDSDLQALAEAVSNSDGTLDMNTIMEKVKDFQSACYDNIEQLKEWRDSVYETLQDAIDQYDEAFDRIDNKIAHSSKMIQSYKDLVAAIGKKNVDPTGQLTARMDQNAINTSESAYRASQAQSEYWKKAVADAQEGLAAAKATGVEADIKYWEDILNNATDKLYESEEDAMDKLNEWVTQLGEAFQHQIEQVIDNLNQSLGGLSDLRESFDRAQEVDAQYIDDYQKIYELSKLTRQVNASIDETDNVKAKKALMEYQQKINEYQADGVQMSEYELEYLQKQYDLELAKIALDEAKDAKSQVRMARDSEGNYGYVYTADESSVAEAEQSYEDKLYEMQELNAQYINDLQDSIITMQEEMSAKLQEIAEDDSLSYEEKMAKMQEVTDYYSERIDYYSEQLGIVLDNNKSLYENDWQEYSEKTGYKISKDEDYIDSWGETTIAVQTGAETQEEYIANVKNGMQIACDDMQDALSDYQQAVRDATDEVIDGAAEQTEVLAETAEEAAQDAEDLEADYEDTLGDAMDATQQFTEDYASYIDDCIQANLDYIDSINDVLAKLRELAAEEGASSGSGSGSGSGDSGSGGGSGAGGGAGSGGGSGAGSVEGVAAAIWMDGGATSGWYNGNDRTSRLKEKGLTEAQAYINAHGPNGDIYAAWHNKREQLKSFYYGSFDTGGYTGEWGDGSGKLALLHSKELVLNAADTENMLKMVDMVRQISNMIDINALSSSLTSGLTAASINANNNGVLEQQVTITAEFPNATDKDQILDAFDNVINLAAQYANRK